MDGNDPEHRHWSELLSAVREYAARHARRHLVFQMPGSRVLHAPVGNQHWYYANTRSDAVPQGFGQEETIKAIWSVEPTSQP
jgi:hypothetical protein